MILICKSRTSKYCLHAVGDPRSAKRRTGTGRANVLPRSLGFVLKAESRSERKEIVSPGISVRRWRAPFGGLAPNISTCFTSIALIQLCQLRTWPALWEIWSNRVRYGSLVFPRRASPTSAVPMPFIRYPRCKANIRCRIGFMLPLTSRSLPEVRLGLFLSRPYRGEQSSLPLQARHEDQHRISRNAERCYQANWSGVALTFR